MFVTAAILAATTPAFNKPDVIRWGATTDQLQQELKPLCSKLGTRKIDPPFLKGVKTQQLQIDCDGFWFFGRGRHVEFVIRDDRLVMVWLMVDENEAPKFIEAMRQAYGPSSAVNRKYIAFEPHRAAWRHEPPEILFYSPEVEAAIRLNFR
jgi:hypothetical protein